MIVAAKKSEYMQPRLEYGTVINRGEESCFSIATAFGPVEAERATGCLVSPAAGDTVLLCFDNAGGAFILSVLCQEPGRAGTELLLNGDVALRIQGGRLAVSADEELSLASNRRIAMTSRQLTIHADQGEAIIGKFSFLAKSFAGEMKRIRLVAGSVEQIYRRLTQRLQDKFSFVEEQLEVQAGSARYITEETLTMQSKNAVHMAEEVVTINAEQIHLG